MSFSNGMSFFPANFMLQTSLDQKDEDDDTHQNHNHQDQHPIFPPQDFNAFLGGKRSMHHHLSGMMEQQNGNENNTNTNNNNAEEDELSDDGSLASGDHHQKKKRLNMEQVKTLEKSFEMGNKLEPDRKVQLARALGLQPRQIAIWFQNRRARWKTKQLEKEYDALKSQFDAIKSQNEVLLSQNQKLQSQIQALTSGGRGAAAGNVVVVATESFNLNKETVDQGSCSNRSENETENSLVKPDIMSRTAGGETGTESPGQIPTSISLFPSSSSANTNSLRLNSSSNLSATQLFFHHSQNQQQQQQQQTNAKDDNFSNMFCGIEDQSGFWPWLEQQQQQQQQHFN